MSDGGQQQLCETVLSACPTRSREWSELRIFPCNVDMSWMCHCGYNFSSPRLHISVIISQGSLYFGHCLQAIAQMLSKYLWHVLSVYCWFAVKIYILQQGLKILKSGPHVVFCRHQCSNATHYADGESRLYSRQCYDKKFVWFCWYRYMFGPVPLTYNAFLVSGQFFTRDSIAGSAYMLRQFRPSVCLSVRPSHGWISQKRLKLRSCSFHHTVAPSL